MASITINKTEYTLIVDGAREKFTAQLQGDDPMVIVPDDTVPALETAGITVPAGAEYAVTREIADGRIYAKLPDSAVEDTAIVIVV
jgi:hypothetical protein